MPSSIYYCYIDSPVGKLLALSQNNALIGLDFETVQHPAHEAWILAPENDVLTKTQQALSRYFKGKKEAFKQIPLALNGTLFQRQIWERLIKIPYGKIVSYGQLANEVDNPKAIRAVGGAVGRNPISIIIPCHRVLGKDNALTGFGGGLPAKRFLLELEGIQYINKGREFVANKNNRY